MSRVVDDRVNPPDTAWAKPCRSAARRALTPLAEAIAVNRPNPAARNAGSSVPVENAPAPTQPDPGATRLAVARPARPPRRADRTRRRVGVPGG